MGRATGGEINQPERERLYRSCYQSNEKMTPKKLLLMKMEM
jgi:hypothetical protein